VQIFATNSKGAVGKAANGIFSAVGHKAD